MNETLYFLGVGLASTATVVDMENFLERFSEYKLHAIATLRGKECHPVIGYISQHCSIPILAFTANELEALMPRLINPSQKVFQMVQCHGVAEAAALAAGGEEAVLAVEKTCVGGITIAIAKVDKI